MRFETKDHITLWMSQLERISQLINVPTPLASFISLYNAPPHLPAIIAQCRSR